MLNNLHSAPLISNAILTVSDRSEEQIGNSPTNCSDEVIITPADFPLVAGQNTDNLNRDITSIETTTTANNTTIALIFVEDAKFVSDPTDHNER